MYYYLYFSNIQTHRKTRLQFCSNWYLYQHVNEHFRASMHILCIHTVYIVDIKTNDIQSGIRPIPRRLKWWSHQRCSPNFLLPIAMYRFRCDFNTMLRTKQYVESCHRYAVCARILEFDLITKASNTRAERIECLNNNKIIKRWPQAIYGIHLNAFIFRNQFWQLILQHHIRNSFTFNQKIMLI